MPSRATRDEHKKRRWKPEEDLSRARENIHGLQKKISDIEKMIDEVTRKKETLEDKNTKFKSIIQRQEGRASLEAVESASRQLQISQKTSFDKGIKLDRLKDERYELEAWKRDWETWKEDIKEECQRRAVYEARIRNERPRSYED